MIAPYSLALQKKRREIKQELRRQARMLPQVSLGHR